MIDSTDNQDPGTLDGLMRIRLSRRDGLKVGLVAGAAASFPALFAGRAAAATPGASVAGDLVGFQTSLAADKVSFAPIAPAPTTDDAIRVPAGYVVDIVAKWGDPILPGAPAFDLNRQTPESQAGQVGYNHDFQAFFPIGDGSKEAVFFVNHEYTDPGKMFPGYNVRTTNTADLKKWVDTELEAHGASVFELQRADANSAWTIKLGARNRRITANTAMVFSGPAARDARLVGGVMGMLNNCAGGTTPWGTVLTCEENFNQYFANNDTNPNAALKVSHARYGVTARATDRQWERVYPNRFDVSVNPEEPLKYGWVVEIDPDDPKSVPVKRTALGRFKHEAATTVIASTGQLVVYSGDDERFDYFYKYVSWNTYDPKLGKANSKLLDEGTLHVAKLQADGSAEWIPLVYGSRPELSGPRFASQADILIRTREAGDAVGATKMDRPEDIEMNPRTGKVYVALTNNARRTSVVTDAAELAANPRSDSREGNRAGHILELTENSRSGHAGKDFRWDIFMLGGDPAAGTRVASAAAAKGSRDQYFAGWTGTVSPIGAPDNIAFSPDGMLWLATDGAPAAIGYNDALHAVPTTGPNRGEVRQFLSVAAGAETCGPLFTPDQKTLFIAVQHPGEDGTLRVAGDPRTNTQSSWPDGPGTPARPATIAVRHREGKAIGQ